MEVMLHVLLALALVRGKLLTHGSVALPQGKEPPASIWQDAEWAPGPICMW